MMAVQASGFPLLSFFFVLTGERGTGGYFNTRLYFLD